MRKAKKRGSIDSLGIWALYWILMPLSGSTYVPAKAVNEEFGILESGVAAERLSLGVMKRDEAVSGIESDTTA